MQALIDEVRDALENVGAVGAIVFDGHSQEMFRIGSLADIQREGLFSALFGGPVEVMRLRQSLEGQLLPQIWSQGGTDCFVSTLPNGVVYGVFSERPLDPAELYRASKTAAEAVERSLRRLQ
jgi:hypothetical protein